MSENLMRDVTPHVAPPVTREPIHVAHESGDGAEPALPGFPAVPPLFADDDAE